MGERSPLAAANPGYAFSAELIAALRDLGVTQFCVCPGSRSAPLAACAATTPGVRVVTHVDERAAAFFALGWMRAGAPAHAPGLRSRLRAFFGARREGDFSAAPASAGPARVSPVALVCTSGTAAANFLPAVAEASRAHLPLLVLTADRPPLLRARGAAQTIDQVQLYGSHARWFHESEVPSADASHIARARELARSAHGMALRTPRGPVHLNLPFDEPLAPAPAPLALHVVDAAAQAPPAADAPRARAAEASARVMPLRRPATTPAAPPAQSPAPDLRAQPPRWRVQSFVAELLRARRPVIVAGEWDASPEEVAVLLEFAQVLRAPLLAEPLSQFRFGAGDARAPKQSVVIAAGDALLRAPSFAQRMAPDLVLRIGAPAVGRACARWLAVHAQARVLAFDPEHFARDPEARVNEWLHFEPAALARAALETPKLRAHAEKYAHEESAPGDGADTDRAAHTHSPEAGEAQHSAHSSNAVHLVPAAADTEHADAPRVPSDAAADTEHTAARLVPSDDNDGADNKHAHTRFISSDADTEHDAAETKHASARLVPSDDDDDADAKKTHTRFMPSDTDADTKDEASLAVSYDDDDDAEQTHARFMPPDTDARFAHSADDAHAQRPHIVRSSSLAPRAPDASWLPHWRAAEAQAWAAIEAAIARDARAALAANALRGLAASLPDGAVLFLSNSLPLRDAETFLPPSARRLRVLANRGANGIDGVLSSALGVAMGGAPVGLALGDLAFLHDAGALFSARRLAKPLRILVLNDGGGGIFDHLPIKAHGAAVRFEEMFRLAHAQSAVEIAAGFGVPAKRAPTNASAEKIAALFHRANARRAQLVEAPLDPRANLAFHRAAWEAVARATEGTAPPPATPERVR